jgi:phosphonate transport system substrate-binding protein
VTGHAGAPPPGRRAFLGLAVALAALSAARADPPSVRVGLSPILSSAGYAALGAWRAYLERRLGRPVRFVQRSSYREMTSLLEEGALEFAWICSNPYLQHEDHLTPVAVPVFEGQPLYRSYVIVPADAAGLDGLEDLEGKVFAFSDPDSNSGYLVVRHRLLERGTRPEDFFRKTFFAYGHANVVHAVAEGLAHGGAVDSYVWDVLARQEPGLAARTRVIWRSDWFGFPPVVASGSAPVGLREALAQALLGMAEDPDGRRVLASLELDAFVSVPPGLYDGVRRLRGEVLAGSRPTASVEP